MNWNAGVAGASLVLNFTHRHHDFANVLGLALVARGFRVLAER